MKKTNFALFVLISSILLMCFFAYNKLEKNKINKESKKGALTSFQKEKFPASKINSSAKSYFWFSKQQKMQGHLDHTCYVNGKEYTEMEEDSIPLSAWPDLKFVMAIPYNEAVITIIDTGFSSYPSLNHVYFSTENF